MHDESPLRRKHATRYELARTLDVQGDKRVLGKYFHAGNFKVYASYVVKERYVAKNIAERKVQ